MSRRYLPDNPRYPHHITIKRVVFVDDDPFGDTEELIIYDGRGRSFTDTTTTGGLNIDENKRKASIPMRFDKWEGGNKHPMDGDTFEVLMGNVREVGMVKDAEPDNDRTIVYWELKRV